MPLRFTAANGIFYAQAFACLGKLSEFCWILPLQLKIGRPQPHSALHTRAEIVRIGNEQDLRRC